MASKRLPEKLKEEVEEKKDESPKNKKKKTENKRPFFDLEFIGGDAKWQSCYPFWLMDVMTDVLKFGGKPECSYYNPGHLTIGTKRNYRLQHKTVPETFIMILESNSENTMSYYEQHLKELEEIVNKKMIANKHESVTLRIVQSTRLY